MEQIIISATATQGVEKGQVEQIEVTVGSIKAEIDKIIEFSLMELDKTLNAYKKTFGYILKNISFQDTILSFDDNGDLIKPLSEQK